MIPSKFGGIHKKIWEGSAANCFSTALFSGMSTFSLNFARLCMAQFGDVICYSGNYARAYALEYASFPQLGPGKPKEEIPVENS